MLSQALLELEVTEHVGAERDARTPERTRQRNGYRDRLWDTRVGTIPLRVPRVRDGSFFPALLEPRRRAGALVAVIQEAYVQGVPTRRVDELVKALGLAGVQLIISDAHEGLKGAIAAVLHGAAWQRCRVHFLRNALALVPKNAQVLVASTIRTVFAQVVAWDAREQWRKVTDSCRGRFDRLADLLDGAEYDVLAYLAFPRAHWRQLWSINPLERLNKEVMRRTNVVGIFPDEAAVVRLVGAILAEQHDEWQVSRRYFSAESLVTLQSPPQEPALALLAVG